MFCVILGSSCRLCCTFHIHNVSSSSILVFLPVFLPSLCPLLLSFLPSTSFLPFLPFFLFPSCALLIFLPSFIFYFFFLILFLSHPILFFFFISPFYSLSLLAWSSLLIIWVSVKDESDLARTIKSITMIKDSQEF